MRDLFRGRWVRRLLITAAAATVAAAGLIVSTYPIIWIGTLIAPRQEAGFSVPAFTYLNKSQTVRGEPLNLVVVGYDIGADAVFEEMGWKEVHGIWQEGLTQAARNLRRKITPISSRYVFGRIQDFAYQGPDSTLWRRHHARVWRQDLPDGTPAWFVAASFDSTIGISSMKPLSLPTHIVAPNIDTERDSLGRALAAKLGASVYYADSLMPVLYRSNGDSSWYFTDGEVLIVAKDAPSGLKATGWQKVRQEYYRVLTHILGVFGVAESGR